MQFITQQPRCAKSRLVEVRNCHFLSVASFYVKKAYSTSMDVLFSSSIAIFLTKNCHYSHVILWKLWKFHSWFSHIGRCYPELRRCTRIWDGYAKPPFSSLWRNPNVLECVRLTPRDVADNHFFTYSTALNKHTRRRSVFTEEENSSLAYLSCIAP